MIATPAALGYTTLGGRAMPHRRAALARLAAVVADLRTALVACEADLALLGAPAPATLPPVTRRRRPREDELTLEAACRRYAEHGERTGELARGTRQNYSAAATWASRVAAEVYDPLRAPRLAEARDALLEHLGASRVTTIITCWRAAWSWCRERGLCSSPWPDEVRRPRAKPTRKAPFSPAEIVDLLGWAGERSPLLRLVLWVLVESAARSGEVCALRRRDAELRKDGALVLAMHQPKQSRVRKVVLSPELARALADRLDRAPGDLLLSWPDDRPIRTAWISLAVLEWSRARGLEGVRDVHSLRRAGCAALATAGVPVEAAARLVGHASPAQHLAYTRLAAFDLESAQRALWLTQPAAAEGDIAADSCGSTVAQPNCALTLDLARACAVRALDALDRAAAAIRDLLAGGGPVRPP